MSKVLSLRLQEHQVGRLERFARRQGKAVSEAAALLLEEALREQEHTMIEFRNSSLGRQAFVRGTSLAVWEVISLADHFRHDPKQLADHLEWPEIKVQAALAYAERFREEVAQALKDAQAVAEELPNLVPQVERVNPDALLTR